MALRANATMVYQGRTVTDAGVVVRFICPDPGPGEVSDYSILITAADVASVTTLASLQTILISKLQAKYRETATLGAKLNLMTPGTTSVVLP